jgi:hypothetical protein
MPFALVFAVEHFDAAELDLDQIEQGFNRAFRERHCFLHPTWILRGHNGTYLRRGNHICAAIFKKK